MPALASSLHTPVFLKEILSFFEDTCLENFLDGTLGLGGHAHAFLEAHPEIQHYFCCDKDVQAKDLAFDRLKGYQKKLRFYHGSFAKVFSQLPSLSCLDGAFIDLGVSSLQLDNLKRGFSFQSDYQLDMRMDESQALSAYEVVNQWSEKELSQLLWEWGQEKKARQLAKAIIQHRKKKPLKTCKELGDLIEGFFPFRGKTHPATRTFQALRMAVNQEMQELKTFLEEVLPYLKPGAKVAVISFHSLEDYWVKQYFKKYAGKNYLGDKENFLRESTCLGSVLTPKPRVPTIEEIRSNPRSRSAKLRVFQKQ